MPNHVSQRMTLVGPRQAVEKFRVAHFIHEELENLRSQIEDLRKRDVEMAKLKKLAESGVKLNDKQVRHLNWWTNWGEANSKSAIADCESALAKIAAGEPGIHFSLESFAPKASFIFDGSLSLDKEKSSGQRNWYSNNISRFGTKWDAYSTRILEEVDDLGAETAKFVFYYETAWSEPKPILDLIAQAYPDLYITLEYIDEGWNFWGIRKSFGYEVIDNVRECEGISEAQDLETFKELMWLERNVREWDDERFKEWLDEESEEWEKRYGWLPQEFRDPSLLGHHKPAILLDDQPH